MTLREKIYLRLDLPFESLKEEGGNDWVRALKEIEEEERQYHFENSKESVKYDLIDKETALYQNIMSSDIKKCLCEKIEISRRKDLTKDEIDYLFNSNDKDVILNLIRNNYLSQEQEEYVLKNGTYLCKKYIKFI